MARIRLLSALVLLGACSTADVEAPRYGSCPRRSPFDESRAPAAQVAEYLALLRRSCEPSSQPEPAPPPPPLFRPPPPCPPALCLVRCRWPSVRPTLPDPCCTIAIADLAAVATGTGAARARSLAQVREWLDGSRPLLCMRFDDEAEWSLAPELAAGLLGLDAATRRELANECDLAGEVAFARAEAAGDADALGAALARFPFARVAGRAARVRAELLLERGELDEAVFAFEDALARCPRSSVVRASAWARLAAARDLRDRSGSAPIVTAVRAEGVDVVSSSVALRIRVEVQEVQNRVRRRWGVPIGATTSLVALRPDGAEAWRTPLPRSRLRCTEDREAAEDRECRIVCVSERIYLADGDLALALDARTGRVLWFRAHGVARHAAMAGVPGRDGRARCPRDDEDFSVELLGPCLWIACGWHLEGLDQRTGALIYDNTPPVEPR